jgi:hypothetical protein
MQAAKQLKSADPLVGQVMQTTPAAISEQFRSGLRNPFGLRVPLTDISVALPVPEAVNRGVANAIEAVSYGKYSPVAPFRGLFSHTTGGIYKGAIQKERDLRWAEKEAMKGRLMDAAPAFRARSSELEEGFRKIAEHHKQIGDPQAYQAFEREMLETAGNMPDAKGIMDALKTRWNLPADASMEGISTETADLGRKFHEFFDSMHTSVKEAGERYKALGGDIEILNDKYADYFPRRLSKAIMKLMGKEQEAMSKGELPDIMQFWRARKGYLRDYPGRSAGLNRLATDKTAMCVKETEEGLARMSAAEHNQALQDAMKQAGIAFDSKANRRALLKQYTLEKYIKPDLQKALDNGEITREIYDSELARFTVAQATGKGKRAFDATDQLIGSMRRLPKEVTQTGIFDRKAVDDWFSYMQSMAENESTLRTAHNMLAQPGVLSMAEDGIPLAKAWKNAGFKAEGLRTYAKKHKITDPDLIRGLTIDERAASALRAFGALTQPDKLNEIGKFVDKVNSTYKGWLTIPFPAFHGRNLLSGYWQNLSDGELGVSSLTAGYRDALRYAHGNKKAMQYVDEFVENGGLGGHGMKVDITGKGAENVVPSRGIRELFEPIVEAGKHPGAAAKNILKMQGGFGAKEGAEGVIAQVGDKTYNLVEFLNRAAPYEALRRKGLTPAQAMYRVNRAQFNYSLLSPFEKTYMRRAIPFYCVDEQTECLTKSGWKRHTDVVLGEDILTYNLKTHSREWRPVLGMFRAPYNGHLLRFAGKTIDLFCTLDHRVVTTTGLKEARDCGISDRIPLNGPYEHSEYEIPDKILKIIGWLVTDGHTRKRTENGWELVVYQKKEPYVTDIRDLLGSDCTEYVHPQTAVIQFYIKNPLKKEVLKYYRDRNDLFCLITQLSVRQLRILRDVMFSAEGCKCYGGTVREFHFFAQENLLVRDAYHTLLLLCGQTSRMGKAGIYISHKPKAKMMRPKVEWYEGVVWCPKTENDTWIMRRNGKIIPTGNTWMRRSIPYTLQRLLERPGGMVAQSIRLESQPDAEGSYTPTFLKEGMNVPWGGGTPTATSFIRQAGLPIEDLNKMVFSGGLPNIGRTAEKIGAQMHPLLTLPVELASGKQLFSGRKIADLEPVTGISAVDKAIHYGPFSRVASEGMSIIDQRKNWWQKALNATTGFKTGTYDLEKLRASDLSRAQAEKLSEDPLIREGTHYYVPRNKRDLPEAKNSVQRIKTLGKLQQAIRKLREKKDLEKQAR